MIRSEFTATREELEEATKKLRAEVEEMKKNLSSLQKWNKPSLDELLAQGHHWEKWRAWYPVKDIHGKWHWRKEIYRVRGNTYVDYDNWSWYYYGTVFDVLKHGI